MKKNVKKILACLLTALLLASVGVPVFAEPAAPVFKAHVVGETALCDETTPVYVAPGETVLVWFDLQGADEVYIPGWISKTLTENGFELVYDPEFAEENYCAKVTVPSNLAEGTEGLLEINWYKPGELYGLYEGRWSDAPFYYTHHLTFIVGEPPAVVEPVFTARVKGREAVYDKDHPITLAQGETVLVQFILENSGIADATPGWIREPLVAAGFTVPDDPVFEDGIVYASITAPETVAAETTVYMNVNWYSYADVTENGWDGATVRFGYFMAFTVEPAAAPAFTDSDTAKETTAGIIALEGVTADELLAQAPGGTLLNAEAQSVVGKLPVCSGMVLKLADGRELTVIVKGDNDGDGRVTTNDARNALRAAIGLDHPSAWQIAASLIKSAETVGTEDARSILRAAIGLDKFVLA